MTPFADESRAAFLRKLLDAGLVLRLFTNDVRITPATKAGDFRPANLPPHTFPADAWVLDGLTAEAAYSCEFKGPHMLRGWYVTSNLLDGAFLIGKAGFVIDGEWEPVFMARRRDVLESVVVRVTVESLVTTHMPAPE